MDENQTTDNRLPDPQEPDISSGGQSTGATSESPQAEQPLILGKFKTQDEALRAYTELESKLGELGNEASLAKQLVKRVAEEQGISEEEARFNLRRVIDQTPQQTFQTQPNYLAEEVARLKLESEFRDLKETNPEVGEFKDVLINLRKQEPSMSMKDLYKNTFGKALDYGRRQAADKQAEKETAQVSTSSNNLPQSQDFSRDLEALKRASQDGDTAAQQAALQSILGKKGLGEKNLWG